MDTVTKAGLDAAKTTSKKVAHKTAEAIGELIGIEIALKPWPVPDVVSRNVGEIFIPPEKRQEI